MQKIEVNLIPGEEKFTYDIARIQKRLSFLATISIIILIGTTLLSFAVFFALDLQNKDVISATTSAKTKIKSLEKREGDLLVLKNRSELIDKILDGRTESIKILTDFEKLSPQGITFQTVESGQKGDLKVLAKATNLFLLNEFIQKLSDPNLTKDFTLIDVSSINRGERGDYSFSLEVLKNEEG